MNDISINTPYASGVSRLDIEKALIAAGKDPQRLGLADLTLVEDFHTMGRIATAGLAELAGLTPDSRVLDAGSGIGGTARFVADTYKCRVDAVDLTEDYCETARWLDGMVGLGDRISVRQGDVTELPFGDDSFDVVFSQHVQMNIADKNALYAEAHRVLNPGGLLALWDITATETGAPRFPLPWADRPEQSHLATPDALRTTIERSGFTIEHWDDLTDQAGQIMRMVLAAPPNPVGLQAFVANFAEKVQNLTAGLADGRLRAIRGIARKS
ncbi:methyltransferase domain-containing protein [Nocardia sp. CDC153]|uniref:class I SAM-dependent methyltransferase n=1 Tax=Nocardia sp. CDC153 TaxID=3112167 RepID=UPI002DB75E23|nr:methyltransferase domain-containing protein [Nocardia sp. CDC153]MEC3952607.1 methyltransferase domain-containing protein [Nocardia sp. CDC153]